MQLDIAISGISPICSMYGIFSYIWVISRANVGTVNIPYIIHGAYGSGCSEVHCRKTGFRPSRGHTAAIGFGGEHCSSTHCDEAWHGKILCQTESRPRAPRPWKEASGHSGPLYKSLKLMAIGRRMCNNIESPKRQMSSLECGYQHIDSHANKSLWPVETRVFSSFAQI